jgi:hypothetical protein
MAIIYQGGQSMPAYGTAAYNAQFTKPTTTTTTKAATTPSTTGSTSGGYWTEGKVVNGVNIGGGVYVPPTTTPTSVAQTNPVSTIKTPVTSPTTGSVSGANATTEAITSLVKSLEEQAAQYKKEADAIAKQQAENSKSILDYFKSAKTPEQAKIEAQKEVGFAPADYFAQQKAGLAEIKSLSDRYAAMEAAKMQQIAQVEGSMASTNFRNNQIAQINRNAAPEMNLLSAQINSKTAVMAAEQGMFNEARQYVAQAVRDATADTEFKLNTMKMFYDMNQDTLDRIDTKYKEALELSISEEQRKLENERNAASDYYNNLAKIKPDIFGSAETGYFEQYIDPKTGQWSIRPASAISTQGTAAGTNPEALPQYITEVAGYRNRDVALRELETNKKLILDTVGESGYQAILQEINKTFPLKPGKTDTQSLSNLTSTQRAMIAPGTTVNVATGQIAPAEIGRWDKANTRDWDWVDTLTNWLFK